MLLGVDGGGTKTIFLMTDSDGTIRGLHLDSNAYHVQIGIDGLKALLERGISSVEQQSGCSRDSIRSAFLGLPALGEDSRVEHQLQGLPAKVLGHDRYKCGNDMVCAWAGSLSGEDGINVVSGTGSIAYGERGGRAARCGGWGELFGDEGSAYWIARQGLSAASMMADRRLEPGPLLDSFRRHFSLRNDLDLSGFVLSGQTATRDRIAGLCSLVAEAANGGDRVATGILVQAGAELAAHVTALTLQLGFGTGETVPVSYSGGVITKIPAIRASLVNCLDQADGQYDIRQPLFSPSAGAVLLAARAIGSKLGPDNLQRIDAAVNR